MKIYNYDSAKDWADILKRPMMDTQQLEATVQTVLDEVKQHGDKALIEFTARFDKVELDTLEVTSEEDKAAVAKVDDTLKNAIRLAHQNIHKFHSAQRQAVEVEETMPGVRCWRKSVGIEKVG